MKVKYNLYGQTILLDIEDVLAIDFTTIEGKEALQTIINNKNNTKVWEDFDDAEINDSIKYSDKEPPSSEHPNEEEEPQSN